MPAEPTIVALQRPTIYKGVTPFILSDLARLAILVAFPWLSLVLPGMMG